MILTVGKNLFNMQLAYINRVNKTVRIVNDKRFVAEFKYDHDDDLSPSLIEDLRTDDYSKPFMEPTE